MLVLQYYYVYIKLHIQKKTIKQLLFLLLCLVAETWYRVWGDEKIVLAIPQIENYGERQGTHCILELNVG